MRRIAGFGIILSVLCVVFALGTRSKPVPCPAGAFVVKGATPVPARDVGTQARMSNENLPKLIRGAAELYNPELAALIAQGPAAVDGVLDVFRQPATLVDDMPLCLLAYALERIGDPRAVPVLADWLQQNLFGPFIWATDFVTQTIKVLDGQGGLNTDSYSYLIDEKLDALMQAHAGQAAAASARARAIVPL